MWLSFDAQKQYQTFVLSKDTGFEPCGNLLILTQNPSKDAPEMAAGLACCVVLEFNDKEETDDFLAELEACIRELKESVTCPPRRPEIDGCMSVAKRS
ncbi:hypothetical protein HDU80_006058 [Chytriomyces hyalinus]|nr:hypothetical protein HDU80_006058 [Chytriomyces hyalinus]